MHSGAPLVTWSAWCVTIKYIGYDTYNVATGLKMEEEAPQAVSMRLGTSHHSDPPNSDTRLLRSPRVNVETPASTRALPILMRATATSTATMMDSLIAQGTTPRTPGSRMHQKTILMDTSTTSLKRECSTMPPHLCPTTSNDASDEIATTI